MGTRAFIYSCMYIPFPTIYICHVCKHALRCSCNFPSRQGADRSFLEELLGYLRQQRRQLDESWTLLQNLEKQKQQELGGASRVAMETSQSGTIPTSSGAGRDGGQRRGRGGERVGTTGVDLSSLYEHCESAV